MSEPQQITKSDLADFMDSVVNEIDNRLHAMEVRMETKMDAKYAKEATVRELAITLDKFLKRLIDYDDEFTLLKAEVDLIKKIFKEKFNIEIALQA